MSTVVKALVVILAGIAIGWFLANNKDQGHHASSVPSQQQQKEERPKAATKEHPASQPEKNPSKEKKTTDAPSSKKSVETTTTDPLEHYMNILKGIQVNVEGVSITQKDMPLASSFKNGPTRASKKKASQGDDDENEEDEAEIETLFANGLDLRAAVDAEEFSTLLTLPATLQFNDRTAPSAFRKELMEAAKKGGDEFVAVLRHPHMKLFSSVLHLLHESHKSQKKQTSKKHPKSQWKWWIDLLPAMPQSGDRATTHHGMFMSNTEFECLHVQGKQTVETLRQQVDLMYNVTLNFCNILSADKKDDKKTATNGALETTCATTKEQVAWAFAILSARQFDVEGMPTVFPVVDAMPYAVNAAVRPGVLRKDKNGRHITIDFIAARDIKKGELLTFRSDVREAIDQLILGGAHSNDQFSEGVQLWVEWDQENSGRLDALNCSTSMASTRMTGSGTWVEDLMKCAQVHVLRKPIPRSGGGAGGDGLQGDSIDVNIGSENINLAANAEEPPAVPDLEEQQKASAETENIGDITRDNYNFDVQEIELAAFDFLNSQVSLVLDNIPNPESHPQCFDTPILSPFGRQIALHNNKLRSMFITFRERLAHAKHLKEDLFKQMNTIEEEAATKGTYEQRLAAFDKKQQELEG